MKTVYFFIIIWSSICFSCSSSRQATNTDTSIQANNIHTVHSVSTEDNSWSNLPNSNSSKIKVLNAAIAFGSLPNGLLLMGYSITENTGTSITTNTIRAISDDVRVRAWIEGSDIILSSEVQKYTETEFGQPQPSGLATCKRGNSTSFPDCWHTILVIANRLGDEKRFQ